MLDSQLSRAARTAARLRLPRHPPALPVSPEEFAENVNTDSSTTEPGRARRAAHSAGVPSGPRRPGGVPEVRKRARRQRSMRLMLTVLTVLSVLAATGSVFGYQYVAGLVPETADIGGLSSVEKGDPVNILLVGSDSRDGLSEAELDASQTDEVEGRRTDTIMVLHANPRTGKATIVSIPRDLRTRVNGQINKINAAGAGGPELLVDTVEQTTGLEINHYVEVNFAGFIKVVEALDGVEICNDSGEALVDKMAGLNLKPGCHRLQGPEALSFVRARYIGGNGDYGRIDRQQQFLRALMKEMTSSGNLVNVPKMLEVGRAVSGVVETDSGFSVTNGVDLARQFGDLSTETVDMRVYPSEAREPQCGGCPAYVYPLPEAPLLMQALAAEAEELPPVGFTDPEKNVTLSGVPVLVQNGGGPDGAARTVAYALEDLGVDASIDGNADAPITAPARVVHPADRADEARLLAGLLGKDTELVPADPADPNAPERSLIVTIGPGFSGLGNQPGASQVNGETNAAAAENP